MTTLLWLLLLFVTGCTEWTVPECENPLRATPCVGPCTVTVDESALTHAWVPYAVVIRDVDGALHCQEIKF
jgi:hypothetical protein